MKQHKTLVTEQSEFLAKFEPLKQALKDNNIVIEEDNFVRPHYALDPSSTGW